MPAIIVDPELLARITRQFQLRGTLQPFNLTENVVPIFDIGRLLGATPQPVVTPAETNSVRVSTENATTFLATGPTLLVPADDVFSDNTTNPTAGTVLADTSRLTAATRIVSGYCNSSGAFDVDFVHRNAADSADLAVWAFRSAPGAGIILLPFAVVNLTDERFIWRAGTTLSGGTANNIQAPAASPSVD